MENVFRKGAKNALYVLLSVVLAAGLLPILPAQQAEAAVDIGANPEPDVDIVVGMPNDYPGTFLDFSEEMTAALEEQGMDPDTFRITDPSVEIDTTDLSSWYVYDHYQNWSTYRTTAVSNGWVDAANASSFNGTSQYPFAQADNTHQETTVNSSATTITNFLKLWRVKYGASAFPNKCAPLNSHLQSVMEDNGTASIYFMGYGTTALNDFLFYPAQGNSKRTFSFNIEASVVDTHTLQGAGYLLNTGLDENGKLQGYILYYQFASKTSGTVYVYKLKGETPSAMQSGVIMNNHITGSPLASQSFSLDATTKKVRVTAELTDSQVTLQQQDYLADGNLSSAVTLFNGPVALDKTGYSGVGPIVSYSGHGCPSLSAFTFTDVVMTYEANAFDSLQGSQYYEGAQQKYFINLGTQTGKANIPTDEDSYISGLKRLNENQIFYLSNVDDGKVLSEIQRDDEGNVTNYGITSENGLYATGSDYITQMAEYIANNYFNKAKYTDIIFDNPLSLANFYIINDETQKQVMTIHQQHMKDGESVKVGMNDLSNKSKPSVSGTKVTGYKYKITDPNGNLVLDHTKDWESNYDNFWYTFTNQSTEGKWTFELTVTDDAGKESSAFSTYLTVFKDKDVPSITVSNSPKANGKLAMAKITLTDEGPGINKDGITLNEDGSGIAAYFVGGEGEEPTDDDWTILKDPVHEYTFTEDSEDYETTGMVVWAKDECGNMTKTTVFKVCHITVLDEEFDEVYDYYVIRDVELGDLPEPESDTYVDEYGTTYTFSGWYSYDYLDGDAKAAITEKTVIENVASLTIYPVYGNDVGHLQFNANGGTIQRTVSDGTTLETTSENQVEYQEVPEGISLHSAVNTYQKALTMVREGYKFTGWTLDAAGTQQISTERIYKYVEKPEETEEGTTEQSGSTQTGSSSTSTTTNTSNSTTTSGSSTSASNGGSNWQGGNNKQNNSWSDNSDTTKTINGQEISIINKTDETETENIQYEYENAVYAQWEICSYNIVFNPNGGVNSRKLGETAKYNSSVASTIAGKSGAMAPTKQGYTFLGWSTNPNATTSAECITTSTVLNMPAGDLTVYAVWQKDNSQFVVTYTGGVDDSNATADQTQAYKKNPSGSEATVFTDLPTATRSGYQFDYWYYVDASDNQQQIIDGVTPTSIANKSDITVYAHWTPVDSTWYVKYFISTGKYTLVKKYLVDESAKDEVDEIVEDANNSPEINKGEIDNSKLTEVTEENNNQEGQTSDSGVVTEAEEETSKQDGTQQGGSDESDGTVKDVAVAVEEPEGDYIEVRQYEYVDSTMKATHTAVTESTVSIPEEDKLAEITIDGQKYWYNQEKTDEVGETSGTVIGKPYLQLKLYYDRYINVTLQDPDEIVGGTIDLSGATDIIDGETAVVTWQPDEGYYVGKVLVDGVYRDDLSNGTQATFENMEDNHTIFVQFLRKDGTTTTTTTTTTVSSTYCQINTSLTGCITGNCYITPTQRKALGTNASVKLTLGDSNCYVEKVTFDGVEMTDYSDLLSNDGLVFANLTSNHTIEVELGNMPSLGGTSTPGKYTITVNRYGGQKDANGKDVSVSPTGVVNSGESYKVLWNGSEDGVTYGGNDDYEVYKVLVDGQSVNSKNDKEFASLSYYQFKNISENHVVDVYFKAKTKAAATTPSTGDVVDENGKSTDPNGDGSDITDGSTGTTGDVTDPTDPTDPTNNGGGNSGDDTTGDTEEPDHNGGTNSDGDPLYSNFLAVNTKITGGPGTITGNAFLEEGQSYDVSWNINDGSSEAKNSDNYSCYEVESVTVTSGSDTVVLSEDEVRSGALRVDEISENTHITVKLAAAKNDVTISSFGPGTVNKSSKTVWKGQDYTGITAKPNSGSVISKVIINGKVVYSLRDGILEAKEAVQDKDSTEDKDATVATQSLDSVFSLLDDGDENGQQNEESEGQDETDSTAVDQTVSHTTNFSQSDIDLINITEDQLIQIYFEPVNVATGAVSSTTTTTTTPEADDPGQTEGKPITTTPRGYVEEEPTTPSDDEPTGNGSGTGKGSDNENNDTGSNVDGGDENTNTPDGSDPVGGQENSQENPGNTPDSGNETPDENTDGDEEGGNTNEEPAKTKYVVDVDNDNDGKPDTNIDLNGDGIPDVNIDYDGDGIPETNVVVDENGKLVTDIPFTVGDSTTYPKPSVNIDTDGDGWPDVNVVEGSTEKPSAKDYVEIDTDGIPIYKPTINVIPATDDEGNIKTDDDGNVVPAKVDDIIGITKGDEPEPKPTVNIDSDGDGFPDVNVDTDGDGLPDLNIIDTDKDGIPDTDPYNPNGSLKTPTVNVVDYDHDGTPDTYIYDENGDPKDPNVNVDTTGDHKPDLNLDTTGNGIPDLNIVDKDGNGQPDPIDVSAILDKDDPTPAPTPNVNVDTDGDNKPDRNVDIDSDGIPDLNIVDSDGDGIVDNDIYEKDDDGTVKTDNDGNPIAKKPTTNIVADKGTGDLLPVKNDDGTYNQPTVNIDVDGDGIGDINKDDNNDGKPDSMLATDNLVPDDPNDVISLINKFTAKKTITADGVVKMLDENGEEVTYDGNTGVTVTSTSSDGNSATGIVEEGATLNLSWEVPDGTSVSEIIVKDAAGKQIGTIEGSAVTTNKNSTTKKFNAKYTVPEGYSQDVKFEVLCTPDAYAANATVGSENQTYTVTPKFEGAGNVEYELSNSATVSKNASKTITWQIDEAYQVNYILVNGELLPWTSEWTSDGAIPIAGSYTLDAISEDTDFVIYVSQVGKKSVNVPINGVIVNRDTNGDGIPDANIDDDGDGIPDSKLDKNGNGIPDEDERYGSDEETTVNLDTDGDGKSDTNLDTDGDGKADVNVDTDGNNKPDINIDTTGDHKPNVNIDTTGDGKPNVNIVDSDYDGIPDSDFDVTKLDELVPTVNIDVDGDNVPDTNVDNTGNGIPDINIDVDGDGIPDVNVDTDGDGIADLNIIDRDGDGIPDSDFNLLNDDLTPNVNVDTDGDGIADLNVDIDGDGIPDVNIDTDGDGIADYNIDSDGDGIPDANIDEDGDGVPDTNLVAEEPTDGNNGENGENGNTGSNGQTDGDGALIEGANADDNGANGASVDGAAAGAGAGAGANGGALAQTGDNPAALALSLSGAGMALVALLAMTARRRKQGNVRPTVRKH
jgi:uncharacterized repeat protein (TIGR02543 family)